MHKSGTMADIFNKSHENTKTICYSVSQHFSSVTAALSQIKDQNFYCFIFNFLKQQEGTVQQIVLIHM